MRKDALLLAGTVDGEVDEYSRTVPVVIAIPPDVDLDLSRFLKNPIALYNHATDDLPVGVASDVELLDGALHMTVGFPTAVAHAETIFRMVRSGVLVAIEGLVIPEDDGPSLLEVSFVSASQAPVAVEADDEERAKAKASAAGATLSAHGRRPKLDSEDRQRTGECICYANIEAGASRASLAGRRADPCGSGACVCQRVTGVRETEYGPRAIVEPCSPNEERHDQMDIPSNPTIIEREIFALDCRRLDAVERVRLDGIDHGGNGDPALRAEAEKLTKEVETKRKRLREIRAALLGRMETRGHEPKNTPEVNAMWKKNLAEAGDDDDDEKMDANPSRDIVAEAEAAMVARHRGAWKTPAGASQ